jgi:hypothetical protein
MVNHTTDPDVVEADRRVERAKASLRARVAVLERRLGDVRDRIDLPAQIRRHPLPAAGIAFALGALVGGRGRGAAPRGAASPITTALVGRPRRVGGTALAVLSALGVQLLRELAFEALGRAAQRWWLPQGAAPGERDAPSGFDPRGRDPRAAP